MNPFVAVILICLNTIALEACDEATAADVLSNRRRERALMRDGLAGCRRPLGARSRDRPYRLCEDTVPARGFRPK